MAENPFKPTPSVNTSSPSSAGKLVRTHDLIPGKVRHVHTARIPGRNDVPGGVGLFNRVPAGKTKKHRSRFMSQ